MGTGRSFWTGQPVGAEPKEEEVTPPMGPGPTSGLFGGGPRSGAPSGPETEGKIGMQRLQGEK